MPAKRTQRKFRNRRRKVGRKSRRVKKNRVVGGDISQIGKTYNVVDADGKQIEKEVNSFNVVPKVNGSELQNVKKYLESQSRFVMGYRKLARPGSQTDFLEIPNVNFFHKLNNNDLQVINEDLRKLITTEVNPEGILPLLESKYNELYPKNKIEDLYFTKDIYQQKQSE